MSTPRRAGCRGKRRKVYVYQNQSVSFGSGQGQRERPLDSVGTKLTGDEVRAWITDAKGDREDQGTRKPEMKAYALPKDDVDALVAYLQTLKK